ncbi:hypothetical protein IW261DRAFT_1571761 [Armillaria novae-zelandiae]|uniref:Uncharacterized protein n=1 Tax=Armillaria novae-zelandiae TaxID=153914 RepID=A0AA39NTR0_9AGAR|nr:hypothetical protein IW261DRAFT_1571761 [Armillaria novae-zelandiae]
MVKAIDTAHNRAISASHINSYNHHSFRYLQTARVLYKDFKMKPIHHVSLHLGEFMRRMGPVHSYRVPAFEHLNFLMQWENTNMKSGELESTFTWTMARASNFLAVFKGDPKVQNQASKLVEEYCRIERETRLGVGILTEELSADNIIDRGRQYFPEVDILESLKMYLLKDGYSGPLDFPTWEFRDLRRVAINGIEYSSVVHQLHGSFVLFRDSSRPEVAVQIQRIFTMKVSRGVDIGLFMAIRGFCAVTPPFPDLYQTVDMGFLTSLELEPPSSLQVVDGFSMCSLTTVYVERFLEPELLLT